MSYRDRFENSRPDQYGQEHYGRRQYGQQHHGWQPSEQQRAEWRGRESREDYPGRESQDWQARASRDNPPFSREPFGHEPFTHAAFGESERPRYFGTGAHGHGGGPSFTGGTYGTADWRSDAPYFDEVGFNRGQYEDPLSPRRSVQPQQRRYPLGPKGYKRSDERLREDISERLMQSYDIDSSEVTVEVSDGKVVLEGTVPNRYMKHAIEDIADSAPGVQDVDNRIRLVGTSVPSTVGK